MEKYILNAVSNYIQKESEITRHHVVVGDFKVRNKVTSDSSPIELYFPHFKQNFINASEDSFSNFRDEIISLGDFLAAEFQGNLLFSFPLIDDQVKTSNKLNLLEYHFQRVRIPLDRVMQIYDNFEMAKSVYSDKELACIAKEHFANQYRI